MNILFIADPLASFNIQKDSTFAMMREATRRGHQLAFCEVGDVYWTQTAPDLALANGGAKAEMGGGKGGGKSGGVMADIQPLRLREFSAPKSASTPASALAASAQNWYETLPAQPLPLNAFDAVVMRKDPPFDAEYFYATHLLEQAAREGAKVFNAPQALRDHPEKLSLMAFSHLAAPTLVTRSMARIQAFHAQHQDIILKPLDGMGGAGVFRVRSDALNLGAIAESLTNNGTRTIMAQRYLPEITAGDKRVLLIAGQPVPYALARIPQGTEVRGNLAAGGKGVAQKLSASDLAIAHEVGPILAQRGLLLVGLDIIGECLTEINVTSPTCFQEIFNQTGYDVAAMFLDALERA